MLTKDEPVQGLHNSRRTVSGPDRLRLDLHSEAGDWARPAAQGQGVGYWRWCALRLHHDGENLVGRQAMAIVGSRGHCGGCRYVKLPGMSRLGRWYEKLIARRHV